MRWRLVGYALLLFVAPLQGAAEDVLNLTTVSEATTQYEEGEKSEDFQARKRAFNRALFLYQLAATEAGGASPSLEVAIGDTYLQLGEYPWALLHYQRASACAPSDAQLTERLDQVAEWLGVKRVTSYLPPLLLPGCRAHDALLFAILLSVVVAGSFAIWVPWLLLRRLLIGSAWFLCAIGIGLWSLAYFSPVEAILVLPTELYSAPDKEQFCLTHPPFPVGSSVQILQITRDGDWVQVTEPTGKVGYIPTACLRLSLQL